MYTKAKHLNFEERDQSNTPIIISIEFKISKAV